VKYKYFKRHKCGIIRIFILTGLLIFLIIQSSSQITAHDNSNRLKILATSDTKIGSVGTYNTFFPQDGKSQQKYRNLFKQEMSAGTVLCYPKSIWKSFKQYDFSQFNTTVNWFEEQGLVQIAHLLVGPNQYYPQWFTDKTYTNKQLEDIMEDYIREVMYSNHNGNKVDVWNVINEPLWLEGGAPYTGTIWNQLGTEEDRSGLTGADKILDHHPVYISKALKIARKYTNNKLELRDNGIEFPDNDEYQMFYQLVKHLLNQGVPLDAVGFQTHLSIEQTYDWEGLRNNIKRYKDLGLEVYITELDVGNDGTERGRKKQKQYYYNVVKAAREGGVDQIHLWGLNDGQMGDYRADEFALLFEGYLEPKPAYYGFQQALSDSN
jgi:GH35 family endo-1,4-beta-xylanase